MKISHQRDLNHSYLVMQTDREIAMDAYPVRMLLGGEVRALLPCRVQTLDGSRAFCYDTTYAQPLSSRLGKGRLGSEELLRLLQDFVRALESVQSYLLDVNKLVIDPEYLYCGEGGLRFCYFPGFERDVGEQFRDLMEYLLPMIDHGDSRAVVVAYGVYRRCMGEDFSVDRLKEYMFKEYKEEEAPALEEEQQITEAEQNRQEVMREFFEREEEAEEEKSGGIPWGTILVSMLWTISLLGICFARWLGYLPFLTFPMILGIFLVLLGILGLNAAVLKRWRRGGGDEGQARWTESSMAQASIQWPGKQVADPEEIRELCREEAAKRTDEPDPGMAASSAGSVSSFTTASPLADIPSPAAVPLSDTQPLPRIPEPGAGRLISREPGRFPDIALTGDLTIIGKLADAVDVQVALPTISRVHAKIRRVDGEYYVTDLGSRNGTYINGTMISLQENRRITPGDAVRFADVEYEFAL